MKNYSLKELIACLNVEYPDQEDRSINQVVVDSREVRDKSLFVCLRGDRVDGHDFAKEAVRKGAVALITERPLDLNVVQILVEDSLAALREISLAYRKKSNAFFIAVTGSNGKTSIKDMLYSVLSQEYRTYATHKNQNTEIGTYLNILSMDLDEKYVVFENGLDKPGDLDVMGSLLSSDAAILSSFAPAHMYQFDSLEHLAKEKLRVFSHLKNRDFTYVQGDYNEYLSSHEFATTYGFNSVNDYMITDVILKEDKTQFKLNGLSYETNLLGKHQASNAASVILLLKDLEIPDRLIRSGLMSVRLTELRTEKIKYKNSLILLDSYKSNPSSLKYALELFAIFKHDGPRYLILSDMVELGEQSLDYHRDILSKIIEIKPDKLITVGNQFVQIIPNNLSFQYRNYENFEKLNNACQDLFMDHALIMIKGSRSFALERLVRKEGDNK